MARPLKISSEAIRAKVYPPTPEAIKDAIEQAVMDAICERFEFEGDV